MKRKTASSTRRPAAVKFKTPRRLRLSIDNENTLNRVFSLRISSRRIVLLVIGALLFAILIGALLLGFTPIKNILPGYLRPADRQEYIAADNRIDSLLNVVQSTNIYLTNLKTVLSGDIDIDSLRTGAIPELIVVDDPDSLIAPTEAELQFAREYERLTGIQPDDFTGAPDDADSNIPAFVPPVRDALVKRGSRPEAPTLNIDPDHTSIYAIASATVTDCHKNPDDTYTIILQHPDGYLSRYTGLTRLYYDRRQRVGAGARIGNVATADNRQPQIVFELWHDGTPLIPTSYIEF